MAQAVSLAHEACAQGEVPIGAVVVVDGSIVGRGFNQPIKAHDATAHAEIVALRQASQRLGNYRLPDATVYVTVEPCMMCAGALVHSRVRRLVIGASEPKAGAIFSHALVTSEWLNHQIEVTHGVLADECGALLSRFFAQRRQQQASEQ